MELEKMEISELVELAEGWGVQVPQAIQEKIGELERAEERAEKFYERINDLDSSVGAANKLRKGEGDKKNDPRTVLETLKRMVELAEKGKEWVEESLRLEKEVRKDLLALFR